MGIITQKRYYEGLEQSRGNRCQLDHRVRRIIVTAITRAKRDHLLKMFHISSVPRFCHLVKSPVLGLGRTASRRNLSFGKDLQGFVRGCTVSGAICTGSATSRALVLHFYPSTMLVTRTIRHSHLFGKRFL
jgi:hypothetical protein